MPQSSSFRPYLPLFGPSDYYFEDFQLNRSAEICHCKEGFLFRVGRHITYQKLFLCRICKLQAGNQSFVDMSIMAARLWTRRVLSAHDCEVMTQEQKEFYVLNLVLCNIHLKLSIFPYLGHKFRYIGPKSPRGGRQELGKNAWLQAWTAKVRKSFSCSFFISKAVSFRCCSTNT